MSLLAEHYNPRVPDRAANRFQIGKIGITRIDCPQRTGMLFQPGDAFTIVSVRAARQSQAE
jgi:hypothetical protein